MILSGNLRKPMCKDWKSYKSVTKRLQWNVKKIAMELSVKFSFRGHFSDINIIKNELDYIFITCINFLLFYKISKNQ